MRYKKVVAGKIEKTAQNRGKPVGILHHLVGDRSKLCDLLRNMTPRIYEFVKGFDDLSALYLHGTDLDDLAMLCRKSRCLDIEHDRLIVKAAFGLSEKRTRHIVDEIRLKTVDYLYLSLAL